MALIGTLYLYKTLSICNETTSIYLFRQILYNLFKDHMKGITMYIIYLLIYSVTNYKTNLAFEYANGFEFLWGSIVAALITLIIDILIFKFSYDWTGFLSKLCIFNSDERQKAHWKFRAILSTLVFLFSLTPLCSICMTPIVHTSYIWVSTAYYDIVNQIAKALTSSI